MGVEGGAGGGLPEKMASRQRFGADWRPTINGELGHCGETRKEQHPLRAPMCAAPTSRPGRDSRGEGRQSDCFATTRYEYGQMSR